MAEKRRTRSGRSRASMSKADQEFVSEAEEILERMRLDLADLRDQQTKRGEADPERINGLFRSAHSLKGLAGLFGFEPVHDLAHHVEDILDGLRLGRVALSPATVSIIERTVLLFASLLAAVGDAASIETMRDEVAELIAAIEQAKQAPAGATDDLSALRIEPSLLRALTEYEEHRLRENLRRGRNILLVESTFEIASFEEGLSEITTAIRKVGEVLSTLPAPGAAAESQIRFSLLVASELSVAQLGARLALPDVTIRSATPDHEQRASDRTEPAPEPVAVLPEEEHPNSDTRELESLKSISETVRVDIRKLDELMNLVGELVIQRGALGDLVAQLQTESGGSRLGADLGKVHKAFDRKLRELQSAVLEVRMVPLRQVFEKISRVVRRLRAELEKDVRLDVRGADTELDKLIVEELVDPLMHIVRNALDHAIEPVAERVAKGKDAQGSIRIEAFQRGNHVVITVSDDGRGIDRVALRARAEQHGLVSPEAVLGDKEVLDLIFAPGISTREQVTETSGRGVGMDVVRHNLTQLGGVVDVESEVGRGTTISMTLPITLAIIQSLIVVVGEQRFAIPLNAVHETLMVEATEVQRSEGREIIDLRGDALLLRRLADEFGAGSSPSGEKHFVVVTGMGDARIGLVVDRLDGQQDTVIKPIQGPIRSIRGIAGATELGDQNPVLVLDVSALIHDAFGRRDVA